MDCIQSSHTGMDMPDLKAEPVPQIIGYPLPVAYRRIGFEA